MSQVACRFSAVVFCLRVRHRDDRTGRRNVTRSGGQVTLPAMPVTIETIKQGSGDGAKDGDTLVVHYTGTLMDGKQFDSSRGRAPFDVTLGQRRVIAGWEQGLQGMKKGERRKLTIPPDLGYGERGAGGAIPPNATLVFDVELIEIKSR